MKAVANTLRMILLACVLLLVSSNASTEARTQEAEPPADNGLTTVAGRVTPGVRPSEPGLARPDAVHVSPRLTPHPVDKSAPIPPGVHPATDRGPEKERRPRPATIQAAAVGTRFDGLDKTNNPFGLEPPEPTVAVGPSHVVELQNLSGRIFTTSGSVVVTFFLSDAFLVPAEFERISDPRILFDAPSGRFFAVLIGFSVATNRGVEMLAVSDSADPTGSWTVHHTFGTGTFPDFPTLGVSNDKVAISSNAFGIQTSLFAGGQTRVYQKSNLLSGVSASTAFFAPSLLYFTMQPAHSLSSTSTLYMGTLPALSPATQLTMFRVDGTPAAGNVTRTPTSIFIGSGSPITSPPNAQQPGGGTIETNDSRLLGAVWKNDHLWLYGNTACVPAGDTATRSCIYFLEVDTASSSLLQRIVYGAVGVHYYYPALTLDAGGNWYAIFGSSSTVEFAGLRHTGQVAGAPGIQDSALLKAGVATYTGRRWGDYFGASPDPTHTNCVWVSGEYAKGAGNLWGTFIAQLNFTGSCSTTPGGKGFGISADSGFAITSHIQQARARSTAFPPRPPSVGLTWSPGTGQTGYLIVRQGFPSGTATVLPAAATPLPAATTSYTDVSTLTETAYCYVLLPVSSTVLGMSDVVCILPNTRAGTSRPGNFTLRLNQSSVASLTWIAPGGQDGYILVAVPLDGTPQTTVSLGAEATGATFNTMGVPACFALVATQGSAFGNGDVVCGIPGLATLTAGDAARLSGAAEQVKRILDDVGR